MADGGIGTAEAVGSLLLLWCAQPGEETGILLSHLQRAADQREDHFHTFFFSFFLQSDLSSVVYLESLNAHTPFQTAGSVR